MYRMFCQADTETYVHRSGRTGRAFTKGTCITLYTKQQVRPACCPRSCLTGHNCVSYVMHRVCCSWHSARLKLPPHLPTPQLVTPRSFLPNQEHLLKHIEQQSGNNFIRIGPPQPADLVRVCAKDALTKLASVHTDMLAVFEETAKEYLKDNGACSGLKPRACKWVGERVGSAGECDGLIDINDVVEGRQHMAVLAVVVVWDGAVVRWWDGVVCWEGVVTSIAFVLRCLLLASLSPTPSSAFLLLTLPLLCLPLSLPQTLCRPWRLLWL
jgi:hypothetical protein